MKIVLLESLAISKEVLFANCPQTNNANYLAFQLPAYQSFLCSRIPAAFLYLADISKQ